MNSRQYAKIMEEAYKQTLLEAGIHNYISVILSADRAEYEVTLEDGSIEIIKSNFEKIED